MDEEFSEIVWANCKDPHYYRYIENEQGEKIIHKYKLDYDSKTFVEIKKENSDVS